MPRVNELCNPLAKDRVDAIATNLSRQIPELSCALLVFLLSFVSAKPQTNLRAALEINHCSSAEDVEPYSIIINQRKRFVPCKWAGHTYIDPEQAERTKDIGQHGVSCYTCRMPEQYINCPLCDAIDPIVPKCPNIFLSLSISLPLPRIFSLFVWLVVCISTCKIWRRIPARCMSSGSDKEFAYLLFKELYVDLSTIRCRTSVSYSRRNLVVFWGDCTITATRGLTGAQRPIISHQFDTCGERGECSSRPN